jgi:uncharacterized protein
MSKQYLLIPVLLLATALAWSLYKPENKPVHVEKALIVNPQDDSEGGLEYSSHPLQIAYMREQKYPGSDLLTEQELEPGSNYQRFVVSYRSEGLKQYALFTIPNGEAPPTGWPAIVFNHGYIPPDQYRTTERYVAYIDGFARAGYAVLRPDYRGHGNSEGQAEGGYGSPAYTIDVLHALNSLKRHRDIDPERIGMWGHSMGGHIMLRSMVIDDSIKAGVIWAGVVGSYEDYSTYWWGRRSRPTPTVSPRPGQRGYWRTQLFETYGSFEENRVFWDSISATTYLNDLSGPLQLHHGSNDTSVPIDLADNFEKRLVKNGSTYEYFRYPGDDHNLSLNFTIAMRRSVDFFNIYVKGEGNQTN